MNKEKQIENYIVTSKIDEERKPEPHPALIDEKTGEVLIPRGKTPAKESVDERA